MTWYRCKRGHYIRRPQVLHTSTHVFCKRCRKIYSGKEMQRMVRIAGNHYLPDDDGLLEYARDRIRLIKKELDNARRKAKDPGKWKARHASYNKTWLQNNPGYYSDYYKSHKEQRDRQSTSWNSEHPQERKKILQRDNARRRSNVNYRRWEALEARKRRKQKA